MVFGLPLGASVWFLVGMGHPSLCHHPARGRHHGGCSQLVCRSQEPAPAASADPEGEDKR